MTRPLPAPIETPRLALEPITPDAAPEMLPVLAHPAIYRFTGGEAPTLSTLRDRYARQSTGRSPDGAQWWFNWMVRSDGAAVGFVQATVDDVDGDRVAALAWVLSPTAQGRGFATEAAEAATAWLAGHGCRRFTASIHPAHSASAGVARRLGMAPTGVVDDDGEDQWAVEA